MKEPRANFMLTVIENKVFVYGGMKGSETDKKSIPSPVMNDIISEVYDPVANTWTAIKFNEDIPLSCFGYTPLEDPYKYILFGGTDGGILTSNTFELDFKENKISFK